MIFYYLILLKTYSKLVPPKAEVPIKNSYNIHPILHQSTAFLYFYSEVLLITSNAI